MKLTEIINMNHPANKELFEDFMRGFKKWEQTPPDDDFPKIFAMFDSLGGGAM